MKIEKNKKTAEIARKILNRVLVMEANSNSCIVAYQPKTPKGLDAFRNAKKQ